MKRQLHADETFPEKLKRWRTERGWSQDRAAEHLGVTLRAYENWEQNVCAPRFPKAIDKLMSLARKPKTS